MGGVEIKWDIQKNGDHREHRLFAANQSFPQFCTACSTHRIVLRTRQLGQPNSLSLAVYQRFPCSKRPSYFTKASVTRAFKALAMSYYGLQKGDVRLKTHHTHYESEPVSSFIHKDSLSPKSRTSFDGNRMRSKCTSATYQL
jgi:hypothetical protein